MLGYKNNKGFTAIDITIAVVVLIIFVTVIVTILYNIYISSSSSLRNAYAMAYVIDIIEQIDNTKYDDITQDNILNNISNMEIPDGYTVTSTVRKYNEIEGNEDKEDIIKIINVTVSYEVGRKLEKVSIDRLNINKEI